MIWIESVNVHGAKRSPHTSISKHWTFISEMAKHSYIQSSSCSQEANALSPSGKNENEDCQIRRSSFHDDQKKKKKREMFISTQQQQVTPHVYEDVWWTTSDDPYVAFSSDLDPVSLLKKKTNAGNLNKKIRDWSRQQTEVFLLPSQASWFFFLHSIISYPQCSVHFKMALSSPRPDSLTFQVRPAPRKRFVIQQHDRYVLVCFTFGWAGGAWRARCVALWGGKRTSGGGGEGGTWNQSRVKSSESITILCLKQ